MTIQIPPGKLCDGRHTWHIPESLGQIRAAIPVTATPEERAEWLKAMAARTGKPLAQRRNRAPRLSEVE